jgi:hypothetical protein
VNVAPVQPNHPLNRSTGAPLATLEDGGFQSQLDALTPGDSESQPALRPFTPLDNIPHLTGDPHRPLKPLDPPPAPLLPINTLDNVPGQRQKSPADQDKVIATARKWVAQTFYGTLLRQMRNSPFKSDLFEGGRGGQAFAPLLDQHLVDSMSKGTANKLTSAIARKLIGKNTHVAPSLRA